MDLILAKLNRACIYIVPKYISYSKSQFDTKEAHHKAIGYMKTTERLKVKRVADVINESIWSSSSGLPLSYLPDRTPLEFRSLQFVEMHHCGYCTWRLRVSKTQGVGEGWAWLARFLNACGHSLKWQGLHSLEHTKLSSRSY
ncbi:hypothetical protein CEY00_Acc03361 [Actinidia chinensis var. chinensis]|uniref:Uncharacterized protein n=1 Tax=Actinidia chinensis var. chinensis TaxID=1590841 RepID=A0A2R6REW3_ACTCC|nr:hypothetical protein CEY00_Acc03361 [Actinidia chinensis var. chinensis]